MDLQGRTGGPMGRGQGASKRRGQGVLRAERGLALYGQVTPTPQFCHLQNGHHPSAHSLLQQGSVISQGHPLRCRQGEEGVGWCPPRCGGSLLSCSDLPPPPPGAPAGALQRTMGAGPSTAALVLGASCCNRNAPGSVSGPEEPGKQTEGSQTQSAQRLAFMSHPETTCSPSHLRACSSVGRCRAVVFTKPSRPGRCGQRAATRSRHPPKRGWAKERGLPGVSGGTGASEFEITWEAVGEEEFLVTAGRGGPPGHLP